jgi:hypothetical protein
MTKVLLYIAIFVSLSFSCYGSEANNFKSIKPSSTIAQSGVSATTNGGDLKTFASTVEDLKPAMARSIFEIQNIPFKPQPDRLIDFKVSTEKLVERSQNVGPFEDYKDYQTRGLSKIPTTVWTYGMADLPDVHIVLTEECAKRLERSKGKSAVQQGDGESAVAHSADEAVARPLDNLHNRVTAQDIPQLIEQMPDPRYFKRIFISDKANPEDDWVTQIYYPKGFVSATAMTEGVLFFYKTNLTSYLRRDVMHEWSHELRYKFWDDPVRQQFHDAVQLESQWNPRPYAARGDSEQWAVLGEKLLGTSADDFLEACEKAPLRTSLWMAALHKCLADVPADCRSVDHMKYEERVKYVLSEVRSKAIAELRNLRASGQTQVLRDQANVLLVYLENH